MGRTNAIMVAATKQHTGKSTVCLAFVAGLIEKKLNVGFIKPVGQQHVRVKGEAGSGSEGGAGGGAGGGEGGAGTIRVDKDCRLFKVIGSCT